MPRAFVLLNADLGCESRVAEDMKNIEGVSEASAVYGVYDILLKIDAESNEKLKECISNKIRRVKGVKSTLTMLILER